MSTPTTFGDVKIGEVFKIHKVTARKIDKRNYEILSGGRVGTIGHTTANALVNGPTSIEKQRTQNRQKWQSLNKLAQSVGYLTWSGLEKAALEGVRIVLN